MNWTCLICGKENEENWICECGFDESKNYERYPILTKVVVKQQEIIKQQKSEKPLKISPGERVVVGAESYSLLGYAISKNNMDLIKILLQREFILEDLDELDAYQHGEVSYSVLGYAIWRGKIGIVESLIKKGADCNSIVEKDRYSRYTALGLATQFGDAEMVKLLLKHGAKKYEMSTYKNVAYSALGLAILHKNLEVLNMLILKEGIDCNEATMRQNDSLNIKSWSAVGQAIFYEDIEIFKLLLNCGVNMESFCIYQEKFSGLNDLEVNLFPKVNLPKAFKLSYSALGYAVNCNNDTIVKLLLEHGLNPNTAKDIRYETGEVDSTVLASWDIIERKNVKLLELFLDYGLVVEDALRYAIDCSTPDIVEVLLKRCKNINNPKFVEGAYGEYLTFDGLKCFVGAYKRSLLAYAIERNKMKVVKLLLDYGASWNSINTNFISQMRLKKKVEAKIRKVSNL